LNAAAQRGDVLLRPYVGESFQLIDAATREQIAIVLSMERAVTVAAQRGGSVWHENSDNRGRALGPPILLLPQGGIQTPTDRLRHLDVLREKWTREVHQLVAVDAERAMHLTEALDDLALMIRRLEEPSTEAGPAPKGSD
jgi:hypothetical protein